MNDPLYAAAFIAIGALWLVFMALPNLRHPPTSSPPEDEGATSPSLHGSCSRCQTPLEPEAPRCNVCGATVR